MRKTKFILLFMIFAILIQTTAFAHTNERNEKETTIENVIDGVLHIPADNPYFPNMTLTQVKQWYVYEVNKFISTGLSKDTLEDYQKDLNYWSVWVFKGQKNQMTIKYQVMVDGFNKDETQDFYLVQKKIYDFIKDYEETYNVYLNFENWDGVIETETTPTIKETVTSSEANNSTTNLIDNTVFDDTTTQDNSITTTRNNDNSNLNASQDNNIIVPIVIAVIITLVISMIVFSFIYKKKK